MAALIAAGYSVTAEAGVYKVATLAEGGTFVIALDAFALDGSVKALTSDGGFTSKGVSAITDAELWTLSAATGGTITNKATETQIAQTEAVASLSGSGVTFTSIAPLKTATSSYTDFQITSGTPAFGNDSGDAELYVVGTPLFTSATLTNQYLKIGNKYLVATGATTAALVDAELVSLYGDAALWSADDKGVITNKKEAAEITVLTSTTATMASTGGKAIEKDANNTNTNVYVEGTDAAVSGLDNTAFVSATASGVATDAESETQANDDAISFATGKTSYLGVYTSNDEYVKIDDKGAVSVTNNQTKPGATNAITVKEVRKGVYSFYNAGKLVSFAGAAAEFNIVFVAGSEKAFYLQSVASSEYLKNDLALDADAANAAQFCLVDGAQEAINGTELAKLEKDGFSLTLKYQSDKGNWLTNLKGNPFVGHLTVVPAATGNNFELKSGDKYIVAEKGLLEDGSMADVYKFTTVTKAALDADKLLKATNKYESIFSATKSEFETTPTAIELKLEAGSPVAIGYYNVLTDVYVGAGANPKPLAFAIGGTSAVLPSELLVKDKFFTVVKVDKQNGNKTLAVQLVEKADLAPTATTSAYGKAAFMTSIGNELEAQWALTWDEANGNYVFTNRESVGVTFTLGVANLYHAGTNTYSSGTDTYIITTVEETSATDGYERLQNVKNKRFNLGYWSKTFNGTAWFTENHNDVKKGEHVIGLDQEKDPLVLSVVDFVGAKNTKDNVASDSIYVVSTLGYFDAKGDYQTTLDTLKVVSYSFINQFNEPMKLGTDKEGQDAYVSDADPKYNSLAEAINAVRTDATVAQKFTLRKDGDKLNLRPVSFAQASGQLYRSFSMADDFNKMYSGDADNGILANTEMYGRVENDLFVIQEIDKPMYRTIVNNLDTISIYRQENNEDVMYEKGLFLGIANKVQFPKIAPAMVADLAHVDAEGHRPQYLLMVEPNVVAGGTWCPEHGFNSGCPHAQPVEGYTEGRYLVNLKDTAIVWGTDNHQTGNPYVNSENFYKLGFVPAAHVADSLIIASDAKKIELNNEDYSVAKFAFRFVDNDEKSFVIETADYKKLGDAKEGEMLPTDGYLKWMNDVVVVVNDIKDADVFNMNEDEKGNPTANEGVSTSAVSVIATDGGVIINGAQGKKVTVSNILGQTIANTVLSSDNVTITAPQGVVVVAVEGEVAVKAIVK